MRWEKNVIYLLGPPPSGAHLCIERGSVAPLVHLVLDYLRALQQSESPMITRIYRLAPHPQSGLEPGLRRFCLCTLVYPQWFRRNRTILRRCGAVQRGFAGWIFSSVGGRGGEPEARARLLVRRV
jgi:hypothetical protein